jgi:hypothetical protein
VSAGQFVERIEHKKANANTDGEKPNEHRRRVDAGARDGAKRQQIDEDNQQKDVHKDGQPNGQIGKTAKMSIQIVY